MPSFDITSEFNQQEVINAIDQMNREIINRYDFKDTNTSVSFANDTISLRSSTEERLNAADQVLREKFAKRNVSIKFLNNFSDEQTTSEAKREYKLKSGLDKEISKVIVKDLFFCINILGSGQEDLADNCSIKDKEELRFRDRNWSEDDSVPYNKACKSNLFCRCIDSFDYKTHTIFIGEITKVIRNNEGDPLLYKDGNYLG